MRETGTGAARSGLRISLLGPPLITVGGVPVEVDTRKAIALLAYIAESDRTQSRDRLAGFLWPDYDEDRAKAALRRTLSTLKKALDGRWISADRYGVGLDRDGLEFDLDTFREHLRTTDDHDHPADEPCASCTASLAGAVDLVDGDFMQGFTLRDAEPFDEWRSLVSESFGREFAAALARLVRAHTAAGDLDAAIDVAEKQVALDPLDEPARRRSMQLYAWKGKRAAALQQYRDCVAVLDRELGVPPLPETTELYEAILSGAVDPLERSALTTPKELLGVDLEVGVHSLRGRDREWETLRGLHAGIKEEGAVVVLEGEAGIGKTRLARDFLLDAETRGARTVSARSYEGDSEVPYALINQLLEPLTDSAGAAAQSALAEASRLVPSLQPSGVNPDPIEDPGAITRFFEGVRQVLVAGLAGKVPGVVLLDDLHWADRASVDLLRYVLRRLTATPICIVVTWRSEEVDEDHPLRSLLGESTDARTILLGRLTKEDVAGLVTDSSAPADTEMTHRLMRETEGVPFFVVEYLVALTGNDSSWEVPSSIDGLLRSRIGSVGPIAKQVLGAAAVIDRSFDFETVWRSSGRTELEVLDALDELVRRRLVIPTPGSETYEFSHEKLRAHSYDAMSPARKRMLHRRVGEAFVATARRGEQLSAQSALIALHMELGGLESEAALFHETAAERARSIFANRDALTHYAAALALDHPDSARLHEGAGDMHVLLGAYNRSIESYEAAAALGQTSVVPRIEHKLGEVHLRRGDWDLSQSHLVAALESLEAEGTDTVRASILTAMSSNALKKGQLDEALDLAHQALDTALAGDDARSLAEVRNQLGILENARGDFAAATGYLNDSLSSAEERGDPAGQVASLNNLAHSARNAGNIARAVELTERAITICASQGDRHREAALHNNLADLMHELGDTDAAMEHLKLATTVLAEIGAEPTGMLPEVWKLVAW